MNVLAEEQRKLFEQGISDDERRSREEKFLELYYSVRKKSESGILSRLSLKTRKKIHRLVLSIIIMKNHLSGFSYEMIGDQRTPADRPVIFAVTHVGKFDIELAAEALKQHFYILTGDFEHLQGTMDGLFLSLNGVIYFNESDKKDRAEVSERMIQHLTECGNLMYFPEGTWNMTPNLPLIPLYWGIISVARQGNALIVPVAAEQYGKRWKFNIGSHFDVLLYEDTVEGKTRAITDLRDTMATLKWSIWETEPQKRSELTQTEWDEYCDARFSEWPYFNLDYIDRLTFKPKGQTSIKDVFAHLNKLVPCRENAFLFNKRLFPAGRILDQ